MSQRAKILSFPLVLRRRDRVDISASRDPATVEEETPAEEAVEGEEGVAGEEAPAEGEEPKKDASPDAAADEKGGN